MKPIETGANCLDALTLPEDIERNLTDKQRGYLFAVRMFAAAGILTFGDKTSVRPLPAILHMCREMLEEIGCDELENA